MRLKHWHVFGQERARICSAWRQARPQWSGREMGRHKASRHVLAGVSILTGLVS
jgi:hypothetical protein